MQRATGMVNWPSLPLLLVDHKAASSFQRRNLSLHRWPRAAPAGEPGLFSGWGLHKARCVYRRKPASMVAGWWRERSTSPPVEKPVGRSGLHGLGSTPDSPATSYVNAWRPFWSVTVWTYTIPLVWEAYQYDEQNTSYVKNAVDKRRPAPPSSGSPRTELKKSQRGGDRSVSPERPELAGRERDDLGGGSRSSGRLRVKWSSDIDRGEAIWKKHPVGAKRARKRHPFT